LATWCTFNEAFGGGRPKQQQQHRIPAEPLTVSDERDSPGSPVFEELFLPPPQKFAAAPHPPIANPTVAELINNNNNNNKRNSVGASSCCCCSSCSGGHSSAGVSCSSKSTPRSSPVPPPPPHLPETVLYGTREAPVLERHCVEGGEFIIAWLSHSNGSSSHSSNASAGHHRVGAAALVPPPALPVPLHPAAVVAGNNEMQSSTSSANSAGAAAAAAAGNQGSSLAAAGGSNNSSNRSFINKPARGWLHSDVVIVREGITYFVRVSRLVVAGLLPTFIPAPLPHARTQSSTTFCYLGSLPSVHPSVHRRGDFLICFRFTVNPILCFFRPANE
jgi:hypothetical protein